MGLRFFNHLVYPRNSWITKKKVATVPESRIHNTAAEVEDIRHFHGLYGIEFWAELAAGSRISLIFPQRSLGFWAFRQVENRVKFKLEMRKHYRLDSAVQDKWPSILVRP